MSSKYISWATSSTGSSVSQEIATLQVLYPGHLLLGPGGNVPTQPGVRLSLAVSIRSKPYHSGSVLTSAANVNDDGQGVFQFPAHANDNNPANFFRNIAETALGGTNQQALMAIYAKPANGKKREWTTNSKTSTNGGGLPAVLSNVQLVSISRTRASRSSNDDKSRPY